MKIIYDKNKAQKKLDEIRRQAARIKKWQKITFILILIFSLTFLSLFIYSFSVKKSFSLSLLIPSVIISIILLLSNLLLSKKIPDICAVENTSAWYHFVVTECKLIEVKRERKENGELITLVVEYDEGKIDEVGLGLFERKEKENVTEDILDLDERMMWIPKKINFLTK